MDTALQNVRRTSPLVHNITNYVTVNDCANILLACGASPVMADDIREVEEITSISSALVINIGTINERTQASMLAAGKKASELNHPAVLDPVGAGASALRTRAALELIENVRFAVIRANISEIKSLYYAMSGLKAAAAPKGVDAGAGDKVTEETLQSSLDLVREFALRAGCIAAVTGEIDIVTDGRTSFCIRNGHPAMSSVTGTGCQLSAMAAAFVAASPESRLKAAAAAVCAMGLAGELAFRRLSPQDGNASYRNYIIDAVFNMTGPILKEGARYEIRA